MGNNAQYISHTFPCGQSFSVGQQVAVSVTYKNTGTTTWVPAATPSSPTGYKLGFMDPYDNTYFVAAGRVVLPNSVSPGQNVTISFTIVVPTGTYELRTRILQEGVEWFGDSSPDGCMITGTSGGPLYDMNEYRIRSDANYNKILSGLNGANDGLQAQTIIKHINGDIDIFNMKYNCTDVFEFHRYSAANQKWLLQTDLGGTDHGCYSLNSWSMPRYWRVGDIITYSGIKLLVYDPLTMQPKGDPWPPGWFDWTAVQEFKSAGSRNFGGNLGTVDYVEIWSHWGTDPHADIEINYYAKGWGWISWTYMDWQGNIKQGPGYWVLKSPSGYYGSIPKPKPPMYSFIYHGSSPSGPIDSFYPSGPYLSALYGGVPGGGASYPPIVPNRGIPYEGSGSWELFTINKMASHQYSIRTQSNWYLSAVNGGGASICTGYQNQTPYSWETFDFIRQADGYYAIKCIDGSHYVNVPNGGETALDAVAISVGTNQKFGLHLISGNNYIMWIKNYTAFGPEFSSMPSLSTLP